MNNDLDTDFERNLELRETVLHGKPLHVQQALLYSLDPAERFAKEHGQDSLYPTSTREVLAFARCDWLLRQYRPGLSGKFTLADITALLDCFQANLFFPDQFDDIASDLCDDLGIELRNYEQTWAAPLIRKLLGLSAGERVALADALEQTWHRAMPDGKEPDEFFAELGIELTPK